MKNTAHGSFHPTALAAVNEALVTLGQDVRLTTLATNAADANSVKAAFVYEGARSRVLRDHNWNFARRTAVVAGCSSFDDGDEFRFSVLKPARCARLIMCYGESGEEVEYLVEGETIKAKTPVARIVYTSDIEDLDKWSPDAYHALILRLAADLAKPITGRINERQLQEQAYLDALGSAKLADARETNVPQDAWGENHYVKAMRGGGRRGRGDIFRR